MKNALQNQLIKKGLFALAIVTVASGTGLVYAATNDTANNTVSGYGTTSDQASAAAATFAAQVSGANSSFAQQVNALSNTAQTRLREQVSQTGANNVATFDSQFRTDTDAYNAALASAFATFNSQVQASANTAQSKDQFIDSFNHAKADYLNSLDAAKNQLADKINKYGDTSNQVKDQFMNGFNSARDAYSNQLEGYKNNFANTISNL